MIELGSLAAVLIAILVGHERNVRKERERWETERAKLLDRIQHPEVRQVEPVEREPTAPPKDTAELAQVGLEVPEFVHVGGED